MRKETIYIAGKVTGLDRDQTIQKFAWACQEVQNIGFCTMNPMEIVGDTNSTWRDAMRICLRAFLSCDAILLLPDALQSKGALIEYQLAKDMGIRVFNSLDQIKAHAKSN